MFKPRESSCVVSRQARLALAVGSVVLLGYKSASAYDVSPAPILQDFESTWQSISNKMPDIFSAGYGGVYTPPPGRAESGNQSVGYDVYDRYDFGTASNPTLYGTGFGLKSMIKSIHTMGGSSYIDLVWNQSGFADSGTSGFAANGGYPGFALTLQTSNAGSPGYNTQGVNAVDGDYHSAYASGDQEERLAGLIDIAQESDNVFIRQPVIAGPDNIPGPTAGDTGWNGFAPANVPNAANAQYYPDLSGPSQTFTDPELGNQTFTRYSFNTTSPMSGTPVAENAMGYLERYAQYMVQVMGADGFRVDAAKNMPEWVMNYLDLATYDSSNRYFLNGQQESIFSFSEVYDSSTSLLQSYISKSGVSTGSSSVGGNRDVYDFPLFFAMQSNLSSNGGFGASGGNNWYNVVNTSIDLNDDGLLNGSQGVKFVSSQDNGAPSLDSVAYAYTLMLPGNAMVYFNGHNFGTEAQRNFPEDGREDALGGAYGKAMTTLVDLRNRYGRGNYRQDFIEQNNLAFERSGSCLVLLSNCTDPGYDSRSFDVTFAPGTPLVEQTGNAGGSVADPNGDIPKVIVVQNGGSLSGSDGGYVNVRFLRNSTYAKGGGSTYYTGDGYLVYGLATPTGSVSLSNTSGVIAAASPSASDSNIAYENGTELNTTISIIKSTSFTLSLATMMNNIAGYGHDHDADGDQAQVKVDGGINVTGGAMDTNPGDVSYGFQNFATTSSPGYYANNGNGGNGSYSQTISSTTLGQGYHYITVMSFRHNSDSTAPPVYTDWKETVYIDLAPPTSTVTGFADTVAGTNENRTLTVNNTDGLANSVNTFLDLPFGLTDAQVLAKLNSSTGATQTDTATYQHSYTGVTSGNHTVTVVSYKPDGTYNIQRFTSIQDSYLSTSTLYGAGIGDLNFDGSVNSSDISLLTSVVQSNNTQFNPAADVNGDGYVNLADTFLMGPVLSAHSVDNNTWNAYNAFINGTYVTTHTYNVVGTNVIYQDTAGTTNVSSGAYLNATYVRGPVLNIAATGKVQIAANPTFGNGTSKVYTFTMAGASNAWTGQLDLTNNGFILESSSSGKNADLARLTNMAKEGFDNGKWDGQGITSSTAAADPQYLHAVGVILNAGQSGAAIYSTFDGQPVDAYSILAGYTYYGDANLDGRVDGSDYTLIDNGYNNHLSGWYNGDFNYDGVVDGSDYTLMDNAFNTQTAGVAALITAQVTGQIAPASAVPEPTAMLGLLPVFGLLGRRTRRRAASNDSNGDSIAV